MNKINISARNIDFCKRQFCDVTNVGSLINRDVKIMSFCIAAVILAYQAKTWRLKPGRFLCLVSKITAVNKCVSKMSVCLKRVVFFY